MSKDLKNIKAVVALKIIKDTLELFGIEHFFMIPTNDANLMVITDEVRLHLNVLEYKNRYMLSIEEMDMTPSKTGMGSFTLYIITRACEIANCNVCLWVRPDNKVAIEWYKKVGFKRKDRKKTCDLWFEKSPNTTTDYFKNKIVDEMYNHLDDLMTLGHEVETLTRML